MEIMALDVEEQFLCDHFKNYDQVKLILKTSWHIYLEPLQAVVLSYLQNVIYLKSSESKTLTACYIPYLNFHSPVLESKINVNDHILELSASIDFIDMLVQYVHSHKLHHSSKFERPLRSSLLSESMECKWDAWFADRFDLFPNNTLFYFLQFVNQMEMKDLLQLLCAKIATKINGKPFNEFKTLLDGNLVANNKFKAQEPQCNCGAH